MIVMIEMPWEALAAEPGKAYLKACIRDAIFREEIPISIPALFHTTDALDPKDPDQKFELVKIRKQMVEEATLVAFYIDHGWSNTMVKAETWVKLRKKKISVRTLYEGL